MARDGGAAGFVRAVGPAAPGCSVSLADGPQALCQCPGGRADPQHRDDRLSRLRLDERCLGAPHGMCSVGCRVQANLLHPVVHDASVLPGSQMQGVVYSTREQEVFRSKFGIFDPRAYRFPGWLGDLELHRSGSFLLHDDGAGCHPLAMTDVANLELDQIAGPQLTVESQVKHGQFPDSMFELQPHPDGPDILELEWRLLAHKFALVPGFVVGLV